MRNKVVINCHKSSYHNQVFDLNTTNIFYPDLNNSNFQQDNYPHKYSNKDNKVTKKYCWVDFKLVKKLIFTLQARHLILFEKFGSDSHEKQLITIELHKIHILLLEI